MKLSLPQLTLKIFFLSLLLMLNTLAQGHQYYVSTPVASTEITTLSKHKNSPKNEGVENLFDDDNQSKFLVMNKQVTVYFTTQTPIAISRYQLVSANDAPGRDPRQWLLEASNDGKQWQAIDQKDLQKFTARNHPYSYSIPTPKKYTQYRISLSHNNRSVWGDNYLQLSEIKIFTNDKQPITDFAADLNVISAGQSISFWDKSKNHPQQWFWQFENGIPATSHKPSPSVQFNKTGAHSVTLTTSNEFGKDIKTVKRMVKVLDVKKPWQGFEYPEVILDHQDTSSEGYQRITRLMPNIEKVIHDIAFKVNKRLYKNFAQSPNFDRIIFSLQWSDTLASRGGSGSTMLLTFSTKYITEKLANKPDEQVLYELEGIFWHELTHGYQYNVDNRQYSPSSDYHAFIEGMADLIRIQAGYHKTRQPKPSQSWLGGYTNTGFFLDWLSQHYQADLAYWLNQSAKTLPNWTFANAIEQIIGEPIDLLWQKYQASLQTTQ